MCKTHCEGLGPAVPPLLGMTASLKLSSGLPLMLGMPRWSDAPIAPAGQLCMMSLPTCLHILQVGVIRTSSTVYSFKE